MSACALTVRHRVTSVALAAGAACAAVAAHTHAQPDLIDFSPVTDPITEFIDSRPGIDGAALLVMRRGQVLHQQTWRDVDTTTQVRIASATKLLSAIAIMSIVDEGLLDLDAPISTYLPDEFEAGTPKGSITTRQLFSHTSGLPAQSTFVSDGDLTLAEAVDRIGRLTPLIAEPGTVFRYGGVSMQVAGRIAEVVTGQPWIGVFIERVVLPLGLDATDYDAFGSTLNPRIAGGARSSVRDYARVLRMLQRGGWHQGQRVLSGAAVDTILSDQTAGAVADPEQLPGGLDTYLGYGIGNWVELRDEKTGIAIEFTSPGAFGTTPWINRELDVFGVFVIENQLAAVDGLVDDVRTFTRSVAACDTDLDGSGTVDGEDLAILLGEWGCTEACAADIDDSGRVTAADLARVLGDFGRSCAG